MTDDTHRLANAEPAQQPDDAPRDENDDPIFDGEDSGNGQKELPMVGREWPERERKVWVEMYPGGDAQIEIGGMDAETLYLQSGEMAALRDILSKFPGDPEQ